MAAEPIVVSFYTLLEKVKTLSDMSDATARQRTVMELITQIVAAHTAHSELVERIDALEQEIKRFEAWEATETRYQLQKLPPGVHVYELKPELAAGEPHHCICQKCYHNRKRSILDQDEHRNGIHHLTCHECGTKLTVGHFVPPRIDQGGGSGGPDAWMGV